MTTTTTEEPSVWPYECEGWRVTFYVYRRDGLHPPRPPAVELELFFARPKIEHLHKHDRQSIRWTRKRKPIDIAKFFPSAQDGWKRADTQEKLCCFVCAEYMPDEVYEYFERCREITRCAMTQ